MDTCRWDMGQHDEYGHLYKWSITATNLFFDRHDYKLVGSFDQ